MTDPMLAKLERVNKILALLEDLEALDHERSAQADLNTISRHDTAKILSKLLRGSISLPEGNSIDIAACRILNEIYLARLDGKKISISDVSLAVDIPATTCLRWLQLLHEHDLIRRVKDPTDGRRVWLHITTLGTQYLESWLSDALHHITRFLATPNAFAPRTN